MSNSNHRPVHPEIEEEAFNLYERMTNPVGRASEIDSSKSSSPTFTVPGLGAIKNPKVPLAIGGAVLGVFLVGSAAHHFLSKAGQPGADQAHSAEVQELIRQNQQLQEQNEVMRLEMMDHVRDTRPWVLFNTCLWNCEGRTANRQSVVTSDSTEPSPSPSVEPSPATSPLPSPQLNRERVVERYVERQPVIIGINPTQSELPANSQHRLLPRHQLNISASSFKPGVSRGYDYAYYNTMLQWYGEVKANDPRFFHSVIVPHAASVPTHLYVEQYDALYLVWSRSN